MLYRGYGLHLLHVNYVLNWKVSLRIPPSTVQTTTASSSSYLPATPSQISIIVLLADLPRDSIIGVSSPLRKVTRLYLFLLPPHIPPYRHKEIPKQKEKIKKICGLFAHALPFTREFVYLGPPDVSGHQIFGSLGRWEMAHPHGKLSFWVEPGEGR